MNTSDAEKNERSLLRRLFPNLVEMDRVKWLAIPIAILWFFAIIIGLTDILFGSRVIE